MGTLAGKGDFGARSPSPRIAAAGRVPRPRPSRRVGGVSIRAQTGREQTGGCPRGSERRAAGEPPPSLPPLLSPRAQFSRSVVSDSATQWTAASQASLSITNSRSLLKLMPIESVMPSNRLILCRSLLPPSIFPTIRVLDFQWSVLRIRWLSSVQFSCSVLSDSLRPHE